MVSHNTGGQLTFLVPADLARGDYYILEVRSSLASGLLRSGRLETSLTVG